MKAAKLVALIAAALVALGLALWMFAPSPDASDARLQGQLLIVDESGAPATDAAVEIFVAPPLSAEEVTYQSRLVATASVRDDGSVAFPTVPTQDLNRFADGDYVNLELNAATSDSAIAAWSYSVKLPDGASISLQPRPEDLEATSGAAMEEGQKQLIEPVVVDGKITLRSR